MPLRCLFLSLCLALTAHGLTVRPPSFTELIATADAIVIGEVTQVESVLRIVGGRRVPFTLVTVLVEETLKGRPSPKVVLQCLGGTVGSESLKVVGVPEFVVGERGFFFVQANGTQFFPLVGITHGLYWQLHDPVTGFEVVVRANGEPLRSTAEVDAPLPSAPRVRSAGGMTTGQFREQIQLELHHASR